MTPNHLALLFHQIPSQTWFRNTLTWLGRRYRFISSAQLEKILNGAESRQRACHISFDDGHHTFATHALAVLQQLQVPVTLFVSPAIIRSGGHYWFQELEQFILQLGETPVRNHLAHRLGCRPENLRPYALTSMVKAMPIDFTLEWIADLKKQHRLAAFAPYNLSYETLKSLAHSPIVTLGAHTLTHPILANEEATRAENEMLGSIQQLQDIIQKPVTTFAYPNGAALDQGPRDKAVLKAAGIALAFTTENQFFNRKTDPFFIPRPGLAGSPRETSVYLRAKLALVPVWDQISPSVRREKRERLLFAERLLKRSG